MKRQRSEAFMDGYFDCMHGRDRSQNPFLKYLNATENRTAPEALIELMLGKAKDWTEGWNKRFYGEKVDSEP